MERHRTFTLVTGDQRLEGTRLSGGALLVQFPDPPVGFLGATPYRDEDNLRAVYPDAELLWHDQERPANPARPRAFILTLDGEELEGAEFSDGTIALQGHGAHKSLAAVMENTDATISFTAPDAATPGMPRITGEPPQPGEGRNFTLTAGGLENLGRRLPSSGLLVLLTLERDERNVFGTVQELLDHFGEHARLAWHGPVRRIILNADTLYDLFNSLKEDRPFPVKLAGGALPIFVDQSFPDRDRRREPRIRRNRPGPRRPGQRGAEVHDRPCRGGHGTAPGVSHGSILIPAHRTHHHHGGIR